MPATTAVRITDAALEVLGTGGIHALSHARVDATAGLPPGSTSNYFRTRAALVAGLVARIGERLAPDPAVVAELGRQPPSRALFAAYVRDIVARLSAAPDVTLALFELRLEGARRPEVGAVLHRWQREAFDADAAFNRAAGLPGGPAEIALFHYALDGLLLDRLTTPLDPATGTDAVVQALAEGLLPPA